MFVLAVLPWVYINHISLILVNSVAWRNETISSLDIYTVIILSVRIAEEKLYSEMISGCPTYCNLHKPGNCFNKSLGTLKYEL